MSDNDKDQNIVFIGGGIGNTHALAEIVDRLETDHLSKDIAKHIHVRLFDIRSDLMGRGAGWAAHPSLLMNSRVFSQGPFHKWLIENKERWIGYLKLHDQSNTLGLHNPDALENKDKWFPKFKDKIDRDDFGDICLPRMVFGYYTQELLYKTFEKAKKIGIDLHLIEGEVDNIASLKDKFKVHLAKGSHEVSLDKIDSIDHVTDYKAKLLDGSDFEDINANSVVLGFGGARQTPPNGIGKNPAYFSFLDVCDANGGFKKIADQITMKYDELNPDSQMPDKKVKIAILGQKSSFVDVCRLLHHDPDIRKKIEVVSISPNGNMPSTYASPPKSYRYKPLFNIDLFSKDDQRIASPEGLLLLWKAEMQHAMQENPKFDVPLAEEAFIYQFLKKGVQNKKIKPNVVLEFFDSNKYEKVDGYTRVWEYTANPAELMKEDEILKIESGFFKNVHESNGTLEIAHEDSTTHEIEQRKFNLVINAMGFAPLKDTSVMVLRNALDSDLVEINKSGKGLNVSANREVKVKGEIKSGLFAVGELVNGNCVSTGRNISRYGQGDSGDTVIDQYRRFGTFFTAIEDGIVVGDQIADRIGLHQSFHGSKIKADNRDERVK